MSKESRKAKKKLRFIEITINLPLQQTVAISSHPRGRMEEREQWNEVPWSY